MAGTPHPFATPYANRDASALLSAEKVYNRKTIADWNAIANGDWAGQFGGLHLLSNNADYDIDTSDTTTAPDGDNFVRDANGILFVKQPIGFADEVRRRVTAAGAVAISPSADQIVSVAKTVEAATIVNFPSVDDRLDAGKRSVLIKNEMSNGALYPLTLTPAGSDTIEGQSTFVMDGTRQSVRLWPDNSVTPNNWEIR